MTCSPDFCEPPRESLSPGRGHENCDLQPGGQKLRCQPGLGMVWGFIPNTSAPSRWCPWSGWAGTLTPSCHRPCCRTGLCRWPARSPALPLHSSPVCCRLQLWGRTSRKVGEPAPTRSPLPSRRPRQAQCPCLVPAHAHSRLATHPARCVI